MTISYSLGYKYQNIARCTQTNKGEFKIPVLCRSSSVKYKCSKLSLFRSTEKRTFDISFSISHSVTLKRLPGRIHFLWTQKPISAVIILVTNETESVRNDFRFFSFLSARHRSSALKVLFFERRLLFLWFEWLFMRYGNAAALRVKHKWSDD